ncbi:hypothetical protein HMI54_009450 [Coelomomyces lativittatus]|nr:hypothetical protein HMI54_009450 [Coelomomyces lativittatus]
MFLCYLFIYALHKSFLTRVNAEPSRQHVHDYLQREQAAVRRAETRRHAHRRRQAQGMPRPCQGPRRRPPPTPLHQLARRTVPVSIVTSLGLRFSLRTLATLTFLGFPSALSLSSLSLVLLLLLLSLSLPLSLLELFVESLLSSLELLSSDSVPPAVFPSLTSLPSCELEEVLLVSLVLVLDEPSESASDSELESPFSECVVEGAAVVVVLSVSPSVCCSVTESLRSGSVVDVVAVVVTVLDESDAVATGSVEVDGGVTSAVSVSILRTGIDPELSPNFTRTFCRTARAVMSPKRSRTPL